MGGCPAEAGVTTHTALNRCTNRYLIFRIDNALRFYRKFGMDEYQLLSKWSLNYHTREVAIREAPIIVWDMGLKWTKTLTQDDLGALLARADTSGIPTNELRSFRRADLVIEATDQKGATCYIAVEISFTVNGRDTTRARRNAAFLTRFTGDRSYPAVAGLAVMTGYMVSLTLARCSGINWIQKFWKRNKHKRTKNTPQHNNAGAFSY